LSGAEQQRVTVVVAAAVCFYRAGLTRVLEGEAGIELARSTASAADAVAAAQGADVVLLDMSLPGAVPAAREIAAGRGSARVVGMAVGDGEDEVVACAEAGVAGYVSRDDTLDDLLAAVRGAVRGEVRCPPAIAATLMRSVASTARRARAARPDPAGAAAPVRLTRREAEIIGLISEGLSNKQIAGRLCIELPTVKNHVHHILDKLGVDRRGEAVARVRSAEI
jgi:two-component system nitrate/nitrite response regulator NarL